jgi:hypothetical protein
VLRHSRLLAGAGRRLLRIAAYLPPSPQSVPKTAVYGAADLTIQLAPSELGVIDSICATYTFDSAGATRLAVYLLSYLLALHGH